MAPSSRELEALFRSQGLSARDARIRALIRGVIAEENERAAQGLSYDDDRVRIAQVHAREDIVLLSGQLGELLRATDSQVVLLRQIRWLLVVLVVALLWKLR